MIRKTVLCIITLITLICSSFVVTAHEAYTYTSSADVMKLPSPYDAEGSFYSDEESVFEDLMAYNNKLYVLDAATSEINVYNSNFDFERKIDFYKDGEKFETGKLSSFYISKEIITVADFEKGNLFLCDMQGNVTKTVALGEKELGKNLFKPTKVIVDCTGATYVLSENEYRGIILIDKEGRFDTFYGAVEIDLTAEVLLDSFWRRFKTDKQIDNSTQYVPGGYADIAIDGNDFVYAVRGVSDSSKELIRKFNPLGNNVLSYKGEFGDLELGLNDSSSFVSIAVDHNGFISVLDKTRQRIFQYTPDGELLYVFGGEGSLNGEFKNAVSIAYFNDKLLVLDSETSSVTVLKKTDFGEKVTSAVLLYRQARFKESEELWNDILVQSGNYEYAYIGCGKIAEMSGEYKEAMHYYKLGNSQKNYSSAFKKYRSVIVKKSFGTVMTALTVIAVFLLVFLKFRKKGANKTTGLKLEQGNKAAYVLYILLHPFDGYHELSFNKKYSLSTAYFIVAAWFLATCLNFNYNGYCFNDNNVEDFNVWIIVFSTVGVLFLFTLSNVLLSSFLEGKGTFGQIWTVLSYALIPYTVWLYAELLFTNILTLEEIMFIYIFRAIFIIWTLAMCFIAMMNVHQYSFGTNILSIFLSIIGVLIIVFILFLIFNLCAQIYDFISTIIKEINYRKLSL